MGPFQPHACRCWSRGDGVWALRQLRQRSKQAGVWRRYQQLPRRGCEQRPRAWRDCGALQPSGGSTPQWGPCSPVVGLHRSGGPAAQCPVCRHVQDSQPHPNYGLRGLDQVGWPAHVLRAWEDALLRVSSARSVVGHCVLWCLRRSVSAHILSKARPGAPTAPLSSDPPSTPFLG